MIPRTIFITGANGFIGHYLSPYLQNKGFSVHCATRSSTLLNDKVDRYFTIPNIDGSTNWIQALLGCNVVIHLAGRAHIITDNSGDPLTAFREVNVEGTLKLARQAAEVGVERFIFISSVKVNGESSADQPFKETDSPNPQDAYGVSKLEAEQGLQQIAHETGMEVVIIRPPLIYGAGVKANFASMINIIRQRIPLPFGAIQNLRSFVYIGNLTDLIIHCINHPAAANQVFFVSDGQDVSTTDLFKSCAHAMNIKPNLLPLPQKFLNVVLCLVGKRNIAQRLCGNLQVDISKAKTLLGWSPPFSMLDGLRATVSNKE